MDDYDLVHEYDLYPVNVTKTEIVFVPLEGENAMELGKYTR